MSAMLEPAGASNTDRRDEPRKPYRVRAFLELGNDLHLAGKTVDLSQSGISLLLPQALRPGSACLLRFSVFIEGSLEVIRARVEVANCVFLSADVRVGCRFVELDSSSKHALGLLMR